MGEIVAATYGKIEQQLYDDPIIATMAWELRLMRVPLADLQHEVGARNGTPKWEFMHRVLDDYKARGGTVPTHIGGPARAILRHLRERSAS